MQRRFPTVRLVRDVMLILLCLLVAGCKKPVVQVSVPKTVRCVFLRNFTRQKLMFLVAINGGTREPFLIEAGRGVFLYEPNPLPEEHPDEPLTHISISGPDGSKMTADCFSGDLQAVLATSGQITAQMVHGPFSSYTVPTRGWLEECHLDAAQPVKNLRSVVAVITPTGS